LRIERIFSLRTISAGGDVFPHAGATSEAILDPSTQLYVNRTKRSGTVDG